ncbi:outer membrane beta-barrel protein [Pseudacidobacterium ailaaui]|jgi:hypothetical protein|uniref:outer membrane beta-barrel protein n=1 Tax=Pseudacidobacterium ailaaui TaxID=1382359 RepID=UPI000A4DDAB4|nr:outer membrane beta-barrel protein [Pseudacidobacterium ailaaui]
MRMSGRNLFACLALCLLSVLLLPGQTTTAADASQSGGIGAQPLPMPPMAGPLQSASPHWIEGGKLAVTGILSGYASTQTNHIAGDASSHFDISNAQVFVQKPAGWWQFYLQGGAYSLPTLGSPQLSSTDAMKDLYGPFPQGYLKLAKGNFDVKAGALPTLIGAEYTFTFQNMNIQRGLLWNQENAVNRGLQMDWSHSKLSTSFSWNDGFYSNRYRWLTGSLSWTFNAANSLCFAAGGNAGANARNTSATPLYLNNEQVYNLIYTYTKGNWVIQPYFQYTDVPTHPSIGIQQGAGTKGGALLMNYSFPHGFSLATREEYLKSTGSPARGSINLLYGPGSGAFSFTASPAYRKDAFFLRGELAIVHATDMAPGAAFGPSGMEATQTRGTIEAGFLF